MLFGFGLILAMLLSLPVVAIATGALGDAPQYTLMRQVPERGDGAYLQVDDGTQQGVIQLYPWNFPLDEFPVDAPHFNPKQIRAMIVSQRGIDDATRYLLFRLDDDSSIAFDTASSPTKIIFTPQTPLKDGNYMIDMPKSGLSSDRQYLYFVLDSSIRTLPIAADDY